MTADEIHFIEIRLFTIISPFSQDQCLIRTENDFLSFELMVKFLGLKAMKSAIYCQVWTSNYLQEIRTMAMMIPIIPRPRNPPMMLVIKRCLNNNILFTMLQCKFYKSFCLQDRDAILFRNSLLIGLYQVMYQFVLRYQLLKIFPVL